MPSAFGDVTDDERRRFGSVLEAHYGFIDEAIGRAIATLGPDDLLLVVSGYGMEPLGFGKRLLERMIGDPDLSGTHEGAPDGFLMAYGASVARGAAARARRRSSTSRRRCCISSGCRSAATWTATRARISSSARSPTSGRSRSFRRTTDER